MEISKYLRQHARTVVGKSQFFVNSFVKALEIYLPVILFSIQIILNLFFLSLYFCLKGLKKLIDKKHLATESL
jgi:hypothetical protein